MKKRYLKRWFEYLLIIIQVILFMMLACDHSNLKILLLSKIIILTLFTINSNILLKYGRTFESKGE